MARRGAAVLEMPEPEYAQESGYPVRGVARPRERLRRDPVEDFAGGYEAPKRREPSRQSRTAAVKLRLGGRLPRSVAGLVGTGVALLGVLAAALWLLMVARSFLLHDPRFAIRSTRSIEIEGNHRLTHAQLLGVFSEDVERNIFEVSLDGRQAELETLPWVKSATLMRLLPGRLRVAIRERTPVAFVRQGGHVGLVDADGVLLDMNAGVQAEHDSFPVVTGIAAGDPASTRAARMRIFERFIAELDAGGAKNTESVSEVDLSNPEDVRAQVDEKGTTVLVHFGEDQFLERFQRMQHLMPQWRAQYPNLAGVDMRYEHEIPLAMAKPMPVAPLKTVPPAKPASVVKLVVHPVMATRPPAIPSAKPMVKAAVPVKPQVPPAHAFVPAPAVKPWQPVALAPAPVETSASVSARTSFATKVPVLPTPKPPVVLKPAFATVKTTAASAAAKPLTFAGAKPPALAAASKKASGGKPAAGKPFVPADTTIQAVQR